jgi:hypothetical protein
MQSRSTKIVVANTISLIVMLVANFIGGSGMLINKSVGEISNKYDTLFAPAGYASSIWSLIFLLMICFCSYQWYLLKHGDPKNYISRTGYWFTLGNVANILWLVCWLNEWLRLSVVVIFLLLTCLCVLTVRLRLELDDEPVRVMLFVWWPVTIYLGWIMVATIACVAAWLVSIGVQDGFIGAEIWTMVMIVIATALYLLLIKIRNLREAAVVGVWAFAAIVFKQWELHHNISITAMIASLALLIVAGIQGLKNLQTSPLAKLRRGEW